MGGCGSACMKSTQCTKQAEAKVSEIMTAFECVCVRLYLHRNSNAMQIVKIQWLTAPEFFSRQRSHAAFEITSTSHRRYCDITWKVRYNDARMQCVVRLTRPTHIFTVRRERFEKLAAKKIRVFRLQLVLVQLQSASGHALIWFYQSFDSYISFGTLSWHSSNKKKKDCVRYRSFFFCVPNADAKWYVWMVLLLGMSSRFRSKWKIWWCLSCWSGSTKKKHFSSLLSRKLGASWNMCDVNLFNEGKITKTHSIWIHPSKLKWYKTLSQLHIWNDLI